MLTKYHLVTQFFFFFDRLSYTKLACATSGIVYEPKKSKRTKRNSGEIKAPSLPTRCKFRCCINTPVACNLKTCIQPGIILSPFLFNYVRQQNQL